MWDSTPMPLPLDAYVDTWHGHEAVQWIERYDRAEPSSLRRIPGPSHPWDAPEEAVQRYGDGDISMPRSTAAPRRGEGALRRPPQRVPVGVGLGDHERRRHPRHAPVVRGHLGHRPCRGSDGRGVGAQGILDDTWIIYTSDHGEMAGPRVHVQVRPVRGAVRVPLIVRPPGGCESRVVDSLVEHLDVPRPFAASPAPPTSLTARADRCSEAVRWVPRTPGRHGERELGFAVFETDRYRLVVDEDAVTPCQLFDLHEDPRRTRDLLPDPLMAPVAEEIMETHVRPFFRIPPARPHPSLFTGGYDE